MAIAFGGALGSASTKTTGTTVTLTTGAAVPVGALVVVIWAADNLSATTPTLSSVTDTKSNTYSVVANVGSGTATAAAGQVAGIAISKLTTALTATDTISAVASSASTVIKVVDAAYFTGADAVIRATATTATGNSTAPSVNYTSGQPGDLLIGVVANQDTALPTGDTDTTNGSWNALGGVNTTAGQATANLAVYSQYKILTASGSQTYNVTITSGQWSIAAVAVVASPNVIQRTIKNEGTSSTAAYTRYNQLAPASAALTSPSYVRFAQGFIPTRTGDIVTAQVQLRKSGSPPSNVYIELWDAGSGTYGTTQIPNSLLATSTARPASSLNTSLQWEEFSFQLGTNQVTSQVLSLTSGTPYYLVVYYPSATAGNDVLFGYDNVDVGYSGNAFYQLGSTWNPGARQNMPFKVEIGSAAVRTPVRRTATGSGLGRQKISKTATGAGTGTQTAVGGKKFSRSVGTWNMGYGDFLYYAKAGPGYSAGTGTIGQNNPIGQTFKGDGRTLDSVYLSGSSSSTGTAVAYIYAHTGTFGVDGVPTGTPLATSDIRTTDLADYVSGTSSYKSFKFSGANRIKLTAGTPYVVMFVNLTMTSMSYSVNFADDVDMYYTLSLPGNYVWTNSVPAYVGSQYSRLVALVLVAPAVGARKVSKTATGSGTGTQTATGARKKARTATSAGTGTQTAARVLTQRRTTTNTGLGTQTAVKLHRSPRTASGSGLGTQTAVKLHRSPRTATASGTGTQTASGTKNKTRTATGSGTGTQTATLRVTYRKTATGAGTGTATVVKRRGQFRTSTVISFGTQTAIKLHRSPRTATGTGTGTATVVDSKATQRTASGSGVGYGISDDQLLHQRSAFGSGTGTATIVKKATRFKTATGSGTGTFNVSIRKGLYRNAQGAGHATTGDFAVAKLTAKRTTTSAGVGYGVGDDDFVHVRSATGTGTGTATNTQKRTRKRQATVSGTGSSSATFIIYGAYARTASGSGTGSSTSSGRHIHSRSGFISQAFGTQTVISKKTAKRQVVSAGVSSQTVTQKHTKVRSVSATGVGHEGAIGKLQAFRTTSTPGIGSASAIKLRTTFAQVDNMGTGTQDDTTLVILGDTGITAAYWGIRAF